MCDLPKTFPFWSLPVLPRSLPQSDGTRGDKEPLCQDPELWSLIANLPEAWVPASVGEGWSVLCTHGSACRPPVPVAPVCLVPRFPEAAENSSSQRNSLEEGFRPEQRPNSMSG